MICLHLPLVASLVLVGASLWCIDWVLSVTLRGDFNSMVVFKSIEKHVSDTLRELENLGVGIHHGVVDIIELKVNEVA